MDLIYLIPVFSVLKQGSPISSQNIVVLGGHDYILDKVTPSKGRINLKFIIKNKLCHFHPHILSPDLDETDEAFRATR